MWLHVFTSGCYTIQCSAPENPMLHTNITALCLIEWELLLIEVLHCGNRDFQHFWLLWPWPWSDDLNIRTQPVVRGHMPYVWICTSYVKAFKSYRVTGRQTYTHIYVQTRPKLYTTPSVVNIAVLLLLPIVIRDSFQVLVQVSAILFICSYRYGYRQYFFTYFLATFDTNTFVAKCTS